MTRFLTDEEMLKIQNMDKNILKNNLNNMSKNDQNTIVNAYTKTKKFWGWQDSENLQGFWWFDKGTQIWIPWVNMIKTPPLTPPLEGEGSIKITKPEIKGLDYVKYKDEPSWNLDLTYDNFQNIYRKQQRWEQLWTAEKNFLADLKLKRELEWKSIQEIFWIETKSDKERKYQNLAMENRNLNSWDLRNALASQGLNYDEIEKVVWYHQPYNEYLQTQNELKARSDEAFAKKKDLLDKQLAETTFQIQENGKERMNILNTGMSFSWFGRSSYALWRRDEVARSVNAEISIAQAKAQAELQLYQAQLEWADAETLGALSQNLVNYTNALKNQQTENAKLAQVLNDEANVRMSQALDNMIALSWINKNEIDKELSKELWYLVNKNWEAVNVDENWNPIMLLSWRKQAYEESKDDRDFMYKTYKDDRDYNFDKEKFVHNTSVDNNKLQIDFGKLGLEKEKLSYEMEKDALDFELKKAEKQWQVSKQFIDWNQKLFDDIRADTKDFSEINRQYSIMKNAWNAYKTWDKSNKATVEQQLIMVFNKMLDPGSVVREWEFDRTAQWQAIIAKFEEQVKRLNQGWAWISDKVLEDLVNGAEIMFNSWKETMMKKKDNLKANASYLWADPTFVDSYFNRELGITSNSDEDDIEKIWNSKKTSTTYWPVKQEKITWPLKPSFSLADQTAINKGNENILVRAMNIALASTRKSWQCWAFVNDYCQKLGIWRIMWDSYASKEKHINSKIPQPWSVAVWNPGWWIKQYWHTGIVKAVNNDGTVTIIDANWKWDEKVMTRKVPIKTILASAWGWRGWFINFA